MLTTTHWLALRCCPRVSGTLSLLLLFGKRLFELLEELTKELEEVFRLFSHLVLGVDLEVGHHGLVHRVNFEFLLLQSFDCVSADF